MEGAPGPVLRFGVFGGLTVLREGEPVQLGGRKQRAVLAVLVLQAGQVVPADRVVEQVWGDDPPPRAEASLQAYVSKLRRQLEPGRRTGERNAVLVTEPAGYRLAAERAAVDLTRFEDLVATARAALTEGDPARAAEDYDTALRLHGPLLPELAGSPWVVEAATPLAIVHADALEGGFEAKLALGGDRDLVAGLEAAVTAHPFRERLRALLAQALYRAGRQTDALRSLAEARRTLAEEIGVQPGPELRAMEADILAHAPHLLASAPDKPSDRPSEPVPPTPPAAGGPARTTSTPLAQSVAASGGSPLTGQVNLVGRDVELGWLVESARLAAAGEGRVVVVGGEPGIGKTRLVEELVEASETDDVVVAWARCVESASSAPFWGYSQIAEQLMAAGVIGDAAQEGISAVGGGVHTIDPSADRLALYGSIVGALRLSPRPLLLVADDIQWADASSLRLLEFIAGTLRSMPVLLVVTVRTVGPDAPAPLVDCLAELARSPGARHVDLHRLSPADVAIWLRRRGADVALDEVARVVHDRTGGNPFFVGELVELLARQGRLDDPTAARGAGVPTAALDVVRRRVSMLPGRTQQILAVASVLGQEIDADVLAHVADVPLTEAIETLDPAVEVDLLRADGTSPGRLLFAHALVADALAAELSLARRARLHAAVVDAIEARRSTQLDDHLPVLLHHARQGVLAGTAPKAFDYAMRAARLADDGLAFETAAAHWDLARQLLDLARPDDRRARYDVLAGLGAARIRADDLDGGQAALLDAIAVAEDLADPAAARQATSALVGASLWRPSSYREVSPPLVAALERALVDLGDEPTPQRAGLVGALADAVYYEPDPSRTRRLSAEAVDVARRTGDPAALLLALNRRFRTLLDEASPAGHEQLADEMDYLAGHGGVGPDLATLAHMARAAVAGERADRPGVEVALTRARRLADHSRLPGLLSQVGWAEASWLLTLGRYDDAGESAVEAHRLSRRARGQEADDVLAVFDLTIAHERGRLADVVDGHMPVLDGRLGLAARELLASMLVETGALDRARALVGPVGSVPDQPHDWLWFEVTIAAALARTELADRAASAVLYERLSPCAGRLALFVGPFLGGTDLALARLAALLDRRAAALHHVAAAVERLDRLDARPALARALLTQGELLAPTDPAASHATLARARAVADEVGVVPVADALDRLQARLKQDPSQRGG